MSEQTLDLCEELNKQLQQLEFKPENIQRIQQMVHYQTAVGQVPLNQKTYLTLALSNVLLEGPAVVPSEIRLGLNMAVDVNDWLDDIKIIVLPFIKANEDKLLG
jgi:hypothetical protein